MRHRVALIHAVEVAMAPIAAAFAQHWPEAERVNLLDDSLSVDRAKTEALTAAVGGRLKALAVYARGLGAHGVLFTCSAFGEAIEAAAAEVPCPVLKPMFEDALQHGARIGMLATFQPSVSSMEQEFRDLLRQRGAELRTICVPEAMAALRAGDEATHNRLLAEAVPQLADCDAIMLAHFSTSRAQASVSARTDRPVLTSPASAVLKLKRALAG